jgi:hypothetical protein
MTALRKRERESERGLEGERGRKRGGERGREREGERKKRKKEIFSRAASCFVVKHGVTEKKYFFSSVL